MNFVPFPNIQTVANVKIKIAAAEYFPLQFLFTTKEKFEQGTCPRKKFLQRQCKLKVPRSSLPPLPSSLLFRPYAPFICHLFRVMSNVVFGMWVILAIYTRRHLFHRNEHTHSANGKHLRDAHNRMNKDLQEQFIILPGVLKSRQTLIFCNFVTVKGSPTTTPC